MGGVSDELYGWDVSFSEGSHERRRSPSARRCCCRIGWLSLDGHKIPIDDWPVVLFGTFAIKCHPAVALGIHAFEEPLNNGGIIFLFHTERFHTLDLTSSLLFSFDRKSFFIYLTYLSHRLLQDIHTLLPLLLFPFNFVFTAIF